MSLTSCNSARRKIVTSGYLKSMEKMKSWTYVRKKGSTWYQVIKKPMRLCRDRVISSIYHTSIMWREKSESDGTYEN
ncbi:unnamed protein product [Brassica oleracea var. botrytis]|uniref:(rape) hypothetical protein n=1 Tax=Brassica napus TaxID=3708 RepID=A0A816JMB7_BRANA|nr:unnamed protein product [Brassica napus]